VLAWTDPSRIMHNTQSSRPLHDTCSLLAEVVRDTMHDTFRMLCLAFMTGTSMLDVMSTSVSIVHSCVKRGGPVSVAAARTVTDGIKDHKLEAARGVSSDQNTSAIPEYLPSPVFPSPTPAVGRRVTRLLANRRIDPVPPDLVLSRSKMGLPESPW
jgi:hypothetical protein